MIIMYLLAVLHLPNSKSSSVIIKKSKAERKFLNEYHMLYYILQNYYFNKLRS